MRVATQNLKIKQLDVKSASRVGVDCSYTHERKKRNKMANNPKLWKNVRNYKKGDVLCDVSQKKVNRMHVVRAVKSILDLK